MTCIFALYLYLIAHYLLKPPCCLNGVVAKGRFHNNRSLRCLHCKPFMERALQKGKQQQKAKSKIYFLAGNRTPNYNFYSLNYHK